MALKYAFTRPDGGTSIVHAAPKEHLERLFGEMTDAQYEAHVRERSIPAGAINVTKLPDDWEQPDREFRDAWSLDKGKVDVDIGKAKKLAEKLGHSPQGLEAVKDVADLKKLMRS